MNSAWIGPFLVLAFGWGQAAFIGVFLVVLVSLLLLPREFIQSGGPAPVWWKSVRVWAVVVCSIQILIYWVFG
jgi:hypothetical protein